MIMNDLGDVETIQSFLARFSGFFDAVVVEIRLILPRSRSEREAHVRLLAQESTHPDAPPTWSTVHLRVRGLSEFRLYEGQVSHLVLSDGLNISALPDGRLSIDMARFTEADTAREDMLRRSGQYLVGDGCSYEVPSGT